MEIMTTTNTNEVIFKGITFTRLFDNFWTATTPEKKTTEFYETFELEDGFIKIYPNENENGYDFVYYSYKWLFRYE